MNDRFDDIVSKLVHGSKCKLDADETLFVVDMVMIFSFLEQSFSDSEIQNDYHANNKPHLISI